MAINATIDGTAYNGINTITAGGKSIHLAETGIVPTGDKAISANGTYDITNYASVSVNVSSSASTERDGGLLHDSKFHDGWYAYNTAGGPVTQTTIDDGTYTIVAGPDFTGNQSFNNTRAFWGVTLEAGKTYKFSYDSATTNETMYLYPVKRITVYPNCFECGEFGNYININAVTKSATFTTTNAYVGLRFACSVPTTLVNPVLVEVE